MITYPTHAICILEDACPERYDPFLEDLEKAVGEGKSSYQQVLDLTDLAANFPERCFQPVGTGRYIDKPLLGKSTERLLYELPTLDHMCCGLGYSIQGDKVKVHIVRGMECVIFSRERNAFMMVIVNEGVLQRSSNDEGKDYFLKTAEQGFMKPSEAAPFFDRQRKLAQPTSSARRPLDMTIPIFANREFFIGG